ncbi:hypothetical protein MBLNU457_2053t1 [Dothideomycetes sp. NU457]
MVKALSFKGDPKPKKRKRTSPPPTTLAHPSTTEDNDPADNDDTTWTLADSPTDLAGPVLLLLPTNPVTCLATDANGTIYASQIENIEDSQPETAEPHDVRQVWIANRVAGSSSVSFKGHHGRYLGADSVGQLSARREAMGVEEGWVVEDYVPSSSAEDATGTEDVVRMGGFTLQTSRKGYLSATAKVKQEEETKRLEVEIRADGEEVHEQSRIVVRMQARFKPKLKVAKTERAREKISRSQIESDAGRRLEEDEVKKLKKARKDGTYHEALLDIKVKGKHDKFA